MPKCGTVGDASPWRVFTPMKDIGRDGEDANLSRHSMPLSLCGCEEGLVLEVDVALNECRIPVGILNESFSLAYLAFFRW